MVNGLLVELEDHNCWTIAEAAGRRGPHRLQHLLSRAAWDEQHVADIAPAWAASHLDDGDAVLIVDETADEESSGNAAGAARQYSGTVGGIAMCQVAVTLTYATSRGHVLIGRALYLPEGCAADEEHRELAGVPEEVMFATKPQLASGLPDRAQSLGIRANHSVTAGSGRTVTAAAAARMIPARAGSGCAPGPGPRAPGTTTGRCSR
jgi:SRSO17 transposase